MATLSRALDLIADNFTTDEDKDDVFSRFKQLVKEYGVNQIYVVEFDPEYITFDMMGESTDWYDFYDENKNFFDTYTCEEHFGEGFLFSENEMYVYISSID